MMPINILIIDDEAENEKFYENYCEKWHLAKMDLNLDTGELTNNESNGANKIIGAVFCSGKKQDSNGNPSFDNDLIEEHIAAGYGDGKQFKWDLVLFDVVFGQDNKFGTQLHKKVLREMSSLPTAFFTGEMRINHQELIEGTPFISKGDTRERFISQLLASAQLSPEQKCALFKEFLPQDLFVRSDKMFGVIAETLNIALATNVLILGESGTGKEMIARLVHQCSPRNKKPFIGINCAAISRELLESELFGHEMGAFTGAVKLKNGKFELANQGTLFLDEIGDMELLLQAKILRVLQNREFYRVGGEKPIKVDVRIVAATNQDLEARMEAKLFRKDLFHRLNVIHIHLPPLRERREEIKYLAEKFVAKIGVKTNEQGKNEVSRNIALHESCDEFFNSYEFPGNVRELENILKGIIALKSDNDVITKDDLTTITKKPEKRDKSSGQLALPVAALQPPAETAIETKSESEKSQALNLNQLIEIIKNMEVDQNDPSLKGIIHVLEKVMGDLMKKLFVAALLKTVSENKVVYAKAVRCLFDEEPPKKGDKKANSRYQTIVSKIYNNVVFSFYARGRSQKMAAEEAVKELVAERSANSVQK